MDARKNPPYLMLGLLLGLAASTPVKAAEGLQTVDAQGRTILSGVPWQPANPGAQPKVVYGTDDRIDVYQETNPERLAWTNSVCGLVYDCDPFCQVGQEDGLIDNGDDTYTLVTSAYMAGGLAPCPTEPFGTQPTATWCTGFMVGDDLIATAGHCFEAGDEGVVAFVFGFWMTDPTTPVTVFDYSQVYWGIQIVGRQHFDQYDYAIVRVDRPINAPGATPLPIRREGAIAAGEPVGVIGHPAGLPMKIAFGSQTAVRDAGPAGYFVANTDTYGGNSGSPVWNQNTGLVEGILVRGEGDFVNGGGCFLSNVVPNDGGRGEDISKTTSFMQFVPRPVLPLGAVDFDAMAYACSSTVQVELRDADLAGAGTENVALSTTGGDAETLSLTETGAGTGTFQGTITTSEDASPTLGNGTLEVLHDHILSVTYEDDDDGTGAPAVATDTATVDCEGPLITNVTIDAVSAVSATIGFDTSEPSTATLRLGLACGSLTQSASGDPGLTSHQITIDNLDPTTDYFFAVEAEDPAGNTTSDDNGGTCYLVTTLEQPDYFTQLFTSGNDLDNLQLTFTPDGSSSYYAACRNSATAFPVDPAGGTLLSLSDDESVQVALASGALVPFYGGNYAAFYVGSNGYVTFGDGDTDTSETLADHFQYPRIAGLFDDLDPTAGGQISWQQLADRAVVTFDAVPQFDAVTPNSTPNSFQIEMFFDATLRITWLDIAAQDGLAGLSDGNGLPADYEASDLTGYGLCEEEGEGEGASQVHTADQNADFSINLSELLRVIQFFNFGGFHCDAGTEDGYAPGSGVPGCDPHDSDYDPPNWQVSLGELLRLIQIFNAHAYHACGGSEDGYCLGAP